MSGTSADGIDAAILHTDGSRFHRTDFAVSFAYDPALRRSIFDAVHDPVAFMADAAAYISLSHAITDAHSAAVMALVKQLPDDADMPRLIGFHGQTIFHEPDANTLSPLGRCTIQLGSGQRLADATGMNVVYDVRQADMAAGGQGAPLAPVFHSALIAAIDAPCPAVIINIGGVANLTYIGTGSNPEIIGFDTGPGNGLMDDYMQSHFNRPFDDGGIVAAQGHSDKGFVARVMQHDFFVKSWPKSLDRQAFAPIVDDAGLDDLRPPDAMASLAALTVASITHAIESLPADIQQIYIAGGGRHNQTLMSGLHDVFGNRLVIDDHVLFDADMLEAELMAYLAARHNAGLPTSFPATTGCTMPICGGQLAQPSRQRLNQRV
ncbi:anhydro-N-acetylmuramic acid kinase [Candidatus Puniceispirillum sp.]|uniref:anhydro-N-acetylmuramic acid kinase n=1 Tax=Candidatus Puniceispirillum sp. TaxID=2026719 RepID=UPI003F699C11